MAQALHHLNRVGVIGSLECDGAQSPRELAERLALDPHVVSCVLDYVERVDPLLERDAAGRYALGAFGRSVVERFGRRDGDGLSLNLFDVRVGAYGPVWSALDAMMTGERPYGPGVQRDGDHAAVGVYKVAGRVVPLLGPLLVEAGVQQVVEVGVPTGIVPALLAGHPGLRGVGLDRDASALPAAAAKARAHGVEGITWVHGDLFEPAGWLHEVDATARTALASIHFHELVADGGERLRRLVGVLSERLPGALLVAFEQPRLPHAAEPETDPVLWSYAASNVLIHHLIKNARILDLAGWKGLLEGTGAVLERTGPLGFLGYHLFVWRLPGGARETPA